VTSASAAEPTLPTAKAHGDAIAGIYETSRRGESSFLGLAARGWEVAVHEAAQDLAAQQARRVASAAHQRDEDSDPLVEQQVQVAMEGAGVAGMADDALAVAVLLVEAESHAVERRHGPESRRVHPPHGLRPQDRRLAVMSVRQMGDHETRHVRPGGGHRPGRARPDDFERDRRLRGAEVGAGEIPRQTGPGRLLEA
jgi:hypothetical protein